MERHLTDLYRILIDSLVGRSCWAAGFQLHVPKPIATGELAVAIASATVPRSRDDQ